MSGPWVCVHANEDEEEVETTVEPSGPVVAEDELDGDDGQIVVVRSQVVENVGHVLGNMFQRIYHLVDGIRADNAATATDLDHNIRRLEAFLQLLMDYVSPVSLSLQGVSLGDVAQSLAQMVGDAVGRPVTIEGGPAEGRLLADAGRLARAFGLLRLQLRPEPECTQGIQLKVATQPGAQLLTLVLVIPRGCVLERSSESEVQWAVAEKLVEIHGGALQQSATASGGVVWEIMLPLQC